MKKAAIWDLDSTLADTRHRRELVPEDKDNPLAWIPYAAACEDDTPILGTAGLFRLLAAEGITNICVTGRNDDPTVRTATYVWQIRHSLVPHETLYMPLNWPASSDNWKMSAATRLLSQYNVVLAVDDWYATCAGYQALGIPTLQPFPPGLGDTIQELKRKLSETDREKTPSA